MGEFSLINPNICGFYRTACYLVASKQKLLPDSLEKYPTSDDSGYESESLETAIGQCLPDTVPLEVTFDNEKTFAQNLTSHSTPQRKKGKKEGSIPLETGFNNLKRFFGNHFDAENLQFTRFKKNINRFITKNKIWSRNNGQCKERYYGYFSPKLWMDLTPSGKKRHSKLYCQECTITHTSIQALFPSSLKQFAKHREENLIHAVEKAAKVAACKRPLKDCTNTIYDIVNQTYKKKYGVTLLEGITKIKDYNIQIKPTNLEKKKEQVNLLRSVKTDTEKGLNKTATDRLVVNYFLYFMYSSEQQQKYQVQIS
jgi:hypothetical protein